MSVDGRSGRQRAPRRGTTPTLSVVVTSLSERRQLEECLASLIPQCTRSGAELIVARSAPASDLAFLRRQQPTVRFIHAPADAGPSQLRGLGMSEANGDIVAFTDDARPADATWIDTLFRHHDAAASEMAASAPVVDWSVYFAERGVVEPRKPSVFHPPTA